MLIVSIEFRYLRVKVIGIFGHYESEKTIGEKKNSRGKNGCNGILKTAVFCFTGSQILG
jgi:hypothetical protein